MDNDRKEALKERARKKKLVSGAERIDLEPGDVLMGEVLDVRTISTDYGPLQVAYIQDGDAVYSLPLGHTALRSGWEEEGVEIGDDVYVEYQGEAESEAGQTYHDYLVARA